MAGDDIPIVVANGTLYGSESGAGPSITKDPGKGHAAARIDFRLDRGARR
jgi:hypothetical protein